jgi:hypothetical protein
VDAVSGGCSIALPVAAGTSKSSPPALACYLTTAGSTVLLAVASSPSTTDPFCGLVLGGGVFNAVMAGALGGDIAVFVVVY